MCHTANTYMLRTVRLLVPAIFPKTNETHSLSAVT